MAEVRIEALAAHEGQEVTLRGWVYNYRSSGKIQFVILRDGTGLCQVVLVKGQVPDGVFESARRLTQESAVEVTGTVRADARAPGGFELAARDLTVIHLAEQDYPITLKEHGVEFLLDHRHLWLRTPRQVAILRIRHEITRAIREFLDGRGFVCTESPILMGTAAEGTTTLFQTQYVSGEPAFLSQSGQLYVEATAAALGKVYTFGPTFRAEKSKTRRHLIEFWMVEPEMAFCTHEENMKLQEELVTHVVESVLRNRQRELETIGRDLEPLKRVQPPFYRLTYEEALEVLREEHARTPDAEWEPVPWGEDFGAPHEATLSRRFDRPVFIERYPAKVKAFYMQPDPDRPELVLNDDLLAPEGYGEIIGGSQRIHDLEVLKQRIREHNLPEDAYQWYIDLRRFGSVPHSGFGLGIERLVAWICGLEHVRETIPFPRLLNRLYP
ncbi:asparagine--tRNA ligase [Caldinitratiruptor microaerophilus]|uniref:Asparagine--tRNA ligase n=1 Tax=Caldinitratiruptor microaerophilus TaxID=671077 RepID=A0AA35CI35_9FIRM|nr:asparagine--tRNA ligase [Caldinitratiruptor microaerophilus]BDG59444.1 asparagine--tRNA ligase [Caldinitratiruptor microaerophilus]